MILLVGLGNPGAEYEQNRHNIGFLALDAIVARHQFEPWRQKFQGDFAEGTVAGIRVIALKPRTYMNDSGRAVQAVAQFYKIAVDDIIVLHDELDLPPSKVKVKTGGGHAGHNGLRSIDAHIGAEFHRVRLGIGHPGNKDLVHNWVLGNFAKSDAEWVASLTQTLAKNAPRMIFKDFNVFMNDVAQAMNPSEIRSELPRPIKPATEVATGGESQGPTPTAKNAMAETLRGLLADKKPPGRRPGG